MDYLQKHEEKHTSFEDYGRLCRRLSSLLAIQVRLRVRPRRSHWHRPHRECSGQFPETGYLSEVPLTLSINLPPDGFAKARSACKAFGCVPYYAIVVDAASVIRCFLISLDHLERIAGGAEDGMRFWQMSDKCLSAYRADALIKGFELHITECSWRNKDE
jgi:hypothetical protein